MTPFNYATATMDEVIAEAKRRDDRTRRGLPIDETPAEIAERILEDDQRLEKQIQAEVRRIYLAHGCEVYNLSQARASKQTAGLGDLCVFHPRTASAWWHESKTPSGELSSAQIRFWELCTACNWGYVVGGVSAAEDQLRRIGAMRE